MRAAVYCRVSTDKEDQANSFESQKRYFSEMIERRPELSLYDIYADEGVSGTTTARRREFNRMIRDARAGRFDCIITKEVSRFARNTVDTLEYTRELKRLGIGVEFVSDGINTLEPDAELRLSIMSSIAQEESRKTSSRVKWGQTRRMEQGVVFGRSLLGYDVEGGKMTINEEGAEIVRKIYRWYAREHMGTAEIARELSEKGILTARGNADWSSSVIVKILKNEKYCGDLRQKKTITPDYLTHRKICNRGQEEQIYLKDHHEPIISRELWEETQREIRRRARKITVNGRTNGAGTEYPLSGKIRCGLCEESFVARKRKNNKGEEYLVWRCRTAVQAGSRNGKGCGVGFQLKNETALKIVVDALETLEPDQEKMKAELKGIIFQGLELAGNTQNQKSERLEKRLAMLERKKCYLLDAYLEGKVSGEELRMMRGEYQKQTEEITEVLNESTFQKSGNERWGQIEEVLQLILNSEEGKEMIAGRLLEKITVYPERRVEIFLKGLSGGWSCQI